MANQKFEITSGKLKTWGITIGLLIILFLTVNKIGPREAAFRVNNFGSYRGVDNIPLVTGLQLCMPFFQHIERVGTTQEHLVWSDDKNEGEPFDQSLQVFCYGGAGFNINVGLNVSVIPSYAPKIWLKWKTVDVQIIMKQWGRNVIRGIYNDASSTMSVDSLLNNFTKLDAQARVRIEDSLGAYGFHVDAINILSKPKAIDKALEDAINRKIIAKQDAETEVQNITKHNALAAQKAADARGDSSYNVIEALGKAEAVKVMHEQLTPLYVDYIKWLNAGPDVPRVPGIVSGSGANLFYQLPAKE